MKSTRLGLESEQKQDNTTLDSVEDFQRKAQERLTPELRNYIGGATESGATLARNLSAFSEFVLRRRVLQDVSDVKTRVSYFGGKIESELPFFPSCINVTPMYPKALLDILKVAKSFKVPIFVSHLSISGTLEVSELPKLVPETSPLVWQMYLESENYDFIFKQARKAQEWGYKALAVTVDTEQSIKLGYAVPPEILPHSFRTVTLSDIKKIKRATSLPLVVKGVMNPEDAAIAVEAGADGIGVSNHGGRIMDCGEAAIEALPEVVKQLRSKKQTRRVEIFFDSGIRRGTDILKALALGARGCLIGRPIFWALVVDRESGVEKVTRILQRELARTAALCGVKDLSRVSPDIIRRI